MISDMSNMRSIYVHSCIDDKGWFHIMLDSLKMVLATVLATSNITEMARTGTCHWQMEKY